MSAVSARIALGTAWLGQMGYRDAWELQRRLALRVAAGELNACLLLLEHPPVYTMGRSGTPDHLKGDPERLRALGADYLDVDRGGSVTFHGPGQLVAYPIVPLARLFPVPGAPGRGDVGRYLRALEGAMIALAALQGVTAQRRSPYTGAWVAGEPFQKKLGAIGVKLAAGGVTQHGAAINVTTDLGWFEQVIPCGIKEGGVTSFQQLGVDGLTPEALALTFAHLLAVELGLVVDLESVALREALALSARLVS